MPERPLTAAYREKSSRVQSLAGLRPVRVEPGSIGATFHGALEELWTPGRLLSAFPPLPR